MRRTLCTTLALCIIAPLVNSQTFPDAPYLTATTDTRPHLSTRKTTITSDPFDGDANVVHNLPNPPKHWWTRHPRVLGILIIGAGAGIGAGIAVSHYRGTCTERYPNGYVYVGTNPCPKD